MKAYSKSIEEWFSMIEQGQIKLPRFQRREAWRPAQMSGLFENILQEPSLPIGVLLVLEVGDKELFHSRFIVGAPETGSRPIMHLLDGQQRMTALWRSLTDNYPDLRVFIRLLTKNATNNSDNAVVDEEGQSIIEVVRRSVSRNTIRPVWADNDVAAIERGLAPLAILRSGSTGESRFNEWREHLRSADVYSDEISDLASEYRNRLQRYGLPFLSLPVETSRETALEVFINMNTSASPLKDFDIVVAQVEEAVGESLHDKIKEILASNPVARNYGRTEDIILSVAALLMDKPPLKKTYLDSSFSENLIKILPHVEKGLEYGLRFLTEEAYFGDKYLPSDVPVYLTCALWAVASNLNLDNLGNARILIRKVLWRACFTDRFGKTSATRAFSDFRALRKSIKDGSSGVCELFNESLYPLPDLDEIKAAGWPGPKDRLPRTILATCLRRRAFDFADGMPISNESIEKRELDHLFACEYLKVSRDNPIVNKALNCALITSATNRNKSGKAPSAYINERAEAANLGRDDIRKRLLSHLIPYDDLVADNYDKFLDQRGKLIESDMEVLCNGGDPM